MPRPAIPNDAGPEGFGPSGAVEHVSVLLDHAGHRIDRIVSPPGYASPEGFWYDARADEWVTVLAGAAGLLFDGEPEPRRLDAGDHILIPAACRHRIAWTCAREGAIWLAVHFPA